MNRLITLLSFTIVFSSIAQIKSELSVHKLAPNHIPLVKIRKEHFTNLRASFISSMVGYKFVYSGKDWFKVGAEINIGSSYNKKPITRFIISPTVFTQFGKKWGWFELGVTHYTGLNFYRIFNASKYFNCPWVCQSRAIYLLGIEVGPAFKFGRKLKQELVLRYIPLFEHRNKIDGFSMHNFEIQYSIRFKKS